MDGTFEKRKKIIYEFICDDFYIPMKQKEMAALLQVSKEQRRELKEVLDSLVDEGKIYVSKKGKYCKGEAQTLIGVYQAHPRGFGFVTVEGREEDIFIGEDDTGGAFHGDTVEVALTRDGSHRRDGHRQRQEGRVVKILSRGMTTLVGLYEKTKKKNYGFVIPDNRRFLEDVFIPEGKDGGAVDGHKVVVELTSYGGPGRKPEGKITEILGHVNDPGVDIMSIVRGSDLPCEFPEKVLNQAGRVPDHISEADMAGRKDIRDWQMVTIDGEEIKLTPIEFDILYLLSSNQGKVFTTDEIFEKVWNEKVYEANNTVMVHIRRLRGKMKEDTRQNKIITTVWGVGYKIEK